MIGAVVGNHQITEKIGEGGMGAVFKGVDLMLEREVAIKVLRPEFSRQPQLVERFRSEAVTLAKLNHPNIATLHSFFRQGEDFFMIMEFVRGETLDSVIKRTGAMPVDQAISLFCQALEGIGHAHTLGIVHRDIKPANMMLTEKGSIKVMDFGIARVLGTARMTKQGMVVGTIEYMSPEQVQGLDTDARSDIYSLGILLYEMLTGRVPFSSENEFQLMKAQIEEAPTPPRAFAPQIPLAVEQAIMRSLAKKPEARYQTVAEFRAVLEKGAGAASAALPTSPQAATPATRIGNPLAASTAAESAMKATRMASDSSATAANQMKETRMDQGGTVPAYNAGQGYNAGGYVAGPAVSSPSFFSKLGLVHYAGAAVLLAALVAVPVVMMGGSGNKSEPQPAAVTPAAPQPAAPSTPAVEQTSAPASNQTSAQPAAPGGIASPVIPGTEPGGNQKAGEQRAGANETAAKPSKPNRKDAADAAARERQRRREAALKALDN